MLCNKLTLRKANKKDFKAIQAVEKKAFGRKAEAVLVKDLIEAPQNTISYIAECDGNIIGHIMLSEIEGPVKALALAPLAVLPKYREMQIGSQLVKRAIKVATKKSYDAIFVLGDVLYYERFGFSSAAADPFKTKWQCNNFMALELVPNALKGKTGELIYPPAFEAV